MKREEDKGQWSVERESKEGAEADRWTDACTKHSQRDFRSSSLLTTI